MKIYAHKKAKRGIKIRKAKEKKTENHKKTLQYHGLRIEKPSAPCYNIG